MSSDSESDGTPSALMFDLSLQDTSEQRRGNSNLSLQNEPQPSTSCDDPQPSTSGDYPGARQESHVTGSQSSIYIPPGINSNSPSPPHNPGKFYPSL